MSEKNDALAIMHLVKITASPAQVYRELTTAEGVRNWWTRDAALEPKIGGAGEFAFYGRQHVIKVRVEELVPETRVTWKFISAAPGWEGSTATFYLRNEDGGTVLAFAHRGLPRADETYAGATTRWGYYLTSLQQFLESGGGGPNPDETIGFATPRFGVDLGE
jgi:uncharacterized protein YndB with AHSA1/START domain